ncbi:peptidyl-tRNA hydrolase [Choiromyces venosus 120613-1]|uniref:Peptidyl-tRNA hydrolase n=1 Tax=Choiromyces venosus 120613-1 TaxID=1336337 RepID=A0A3N4K8U8_9PEZI|nr:peptidyl-tRNA hydrolase [Choiromyces venosus 120613-1]
MAQRRILVCSIGNPGQYLNTRHSAGHTLSNLLQETLAFPPFRKNSNYGGDVSVGRFDSTYTLFQSPTLMNISGKAVKKAWKAFMAELSEEEKKNALLVVLHDELEAALGRVKVKKGGSARGHNGIMSCAESLGSKDFCRIGIGIGRPDSRDRGTVSDYVLGKMTSHEKDMLKMESLPEVLSALEKLSVV